MKLSLAGWSLHRLFRSPTNPLTLIDFPALAASRFGLDAVELNSPFFDSREPKYIRQLAAAAEAAKVRLLNIAVDEVGDLSADNDLDRSRAVMSYGRWVPIAAELGCVAVRVNTGGMGIIDVTKALLCCVDSFRRLADLGVKHGVSILLENHGGLSATPDHIIHIIESVRLTHGNTVIGTLPDFGNWPDGIDRLASLAAILPYAKAMHAKVLEVDDKGHHAKYDIGACVNLVRQSGYDGYLGVEFEGSGDPIEGTMRALALLNGML